MTFFTKITTLLVGFAAMAELLGLMCLLNLLPSQPMGNLLPTLSGMCSKMVLTNCASLIAVPTITFSWAASWLTTTRTFGALWGMKQMVSKFTTKRQVLPSLWLHLKAWMLKTMALCMLTCKQWVAYPQHKLTFGTLLLLLKHQVMQTWTCKVASMSTSMAPVLTSWITAVANSHFG